MLIWNYEDQQMKCSQSFTLTHSHLIFLGVGQRVRDYENSMLTPLTTFPSSSYPYLAPNLACPPIPVSKNSLSLQCIFARKFDPTSWQIGRHTVRPHFAKSCSFPVLTLAEFYHLTSLTLWCGENILAFPASPPPTGQSWVELWGDTSTQRKRCSRCKRRLLPLFNLCPLHSLSSSSILVIYPKSSLSQLNLMVEHNTGSKLGLEDWQALSQVRTRMNKIYYFWFLWKHELPPLRLCLHCCLTFPGQAPLAKCPCGKWQILSRGISLLFLASSF